MAEEEEPQQQSIQARIAALNLGQVGRGPVAAGNSQQPRPIVTKPRLDSRRKTAVEPVNRHGSIERNGIGNEPNGRHGGAVLPPPIITCTAPKDTSSIQAASLPPQLPPRKKSYPQLQSSPALPPRRPSDRVERRGSTESVSSVVSAVSSASTLSAISNGTARTSTPRTPSAEAPRIRAPVYDPSALPPLPAKRSPREMKPVRIPLQGTKSSPLITTSEIVAPSRTPTLPTLPQRPKVRNITGDFTRRLPSSVLLPVPPRSLSTGNQDETNDANSPASRRTPSPAPPPVPLSSRPDLSRLLSSKPKVPMLSPTVPPRLASSKSCMKCRDFRGPDSHAAKFPRRTVQSLDSLATQLTAPFPSATDKARVIFTWLHHNISYDVDAFFNDRVQPSTPASTLASGLAVCEGYAGLFTTIASKAGMGSIVVGGHGKGYGFDPIPPGGLIPPESANHAWSAVEIDDGEWKLIDPCWGAGNVSGKGQPYKKEFSPSHFTADNDEFGLRHFPTNQNHFFRTDGRPQISWAEYIMGDPGGEPVRAFGKVAVTEGIAEHQFLPRYARLPISPAAHAGTSIRFQFERVCPHWDALRHGPGPPYQYVLFLGVSADGQAGDWVPFHTDGRMWWVDVRPEQLGARGERATVYTVDTVDGENARGLTKEGYLGAKGRKGMGFVSLISWELV